MPNTTIIIPTYWGWPGGHPPQANDAIFDHPTPLDGESTLPRLLESLRHQKQKGFNVLVISAAVNAQLNKQVEEKVTQLIAPFKSDYPIAQFSAKDLAVLRQRVEALKFDPALVGLDNYSNIRNIQLIIPHIMGAEIIIAVDDDEVVDPNYTRQASTFAGRKWEGESVSGVAGIYLDAAGEWHLPEKPSTGNLFTDKPAIMNEGARLLMEKRQPLAKSPMSYGGNMVFHRDLFTNICFDPGITRGEDIDYLINAHLGGYAFWFDKALTITHLPPEAHQTSPYTKLREDVIRFIYEREKLRQANIEPALFNPYPGRFLDGNLESHALLALEEAVTPEDAARLGSPLEVLEHAKAHTKKYLPRYFEFREIWPQLMNALKDDDVLRELVARKFQ